MTLQPVAAKISVGATESEGLPEARRSVSHSHGWQFFLGGGRRLGLCFSPWRLLPRLFECPPHIVVGQALPEGKNTFMT